MLSMNCFDMDDDLEIFPEDNLILISSLSQYKQFEYNKFLIALYHLIRFNRRSRLEELILYSCKLAISSSHKILTLGE